MPHVANDLRRAADRQQRRGAVQPARASVGALINLVIAMPALPLAIFIAVLLGIGPAGGVPTVNTAFATGFAPEHSDDDACAAPPPLDRRTAIRRK